MSSRRRRSKSSGQSAPARLNAAAARSAGEAPAASSAAVAARTISTRAGSGEPALWMSPQPRAPGSQHGAAGIDDDGRRLRVAVDAQQRPFTPRSGGAGRAGGHGAPGGDVVDALGHVELPDEGVRAQRRMPSSRVPAQAVSAASAWYSPSISTRPRTWRGKGCGQDLDAVARAAPEHLDDEVVRKARKRAAGVRHVHRMDLVLVVEDRVHHVDRELELVDAAA